MWKMEFTKRHAGILHDRPPSLVRRSVYATRRLDIRKLPTDALQCAVLLTHVAYAVALNERSRLEPGRSYVQNISPGFSTMQASLSRAIPFASPSSCDIRGSSCSIDIT